MSRVDTVQREAGEDAATRRWVETTLAKASRPYVESRFWKFIATWVWWIGPKLVSWIVTRKAADMFYRHQQHPFSDAVVEAANARGIPLKKIGPKIRSKVVEDTTKCASESTSSTGGR